MTDNQAKQLNNLAESVLRLSRNTLLVNLRFMDNALSMFELYPTEQTTFATDSRRLLYNRVHVIKMNTLVRSITSLLIWTDALSTHVLRRMISELYSICIDSLWHR